MDMQMSYKYNHRKLTSMPTLCSSSPMLSQFVIDPIATYAPQLPLLLEKLSHFSMIYLAIPFNKYVLT